jgi:hypothetical protein
MDRAVDKAAPSSKYLQNFLAKDLGNVEVAGQFQRERGGRVTTNPTSWILLRRLQPEEPL